MSERRTRVAGYQRITIEGVHGEFTPQQQILVEALRRKPSGSVEEAVVGLLLSVEVAERLARWILKVVGDLRRPDAGEEPAASPEFEQEWGAYLKLKPLLVELYPDRYVAIHRGRIVDHHPDAAALAARFFEAYGDVPVCIAKAGEEDVLLSVPTPLTG